MDAKICKTCGINKSIDDFYFYHGYYNGSCKMCNITKHKMWAEKNKEYLNTYQRKIYHTNPARKEKCIECKSKYYHNPDNKLKIKKASLLYFRKYRQNPKNRIVSNLRKRLSLALHRTYKSDNTLNLISCSKEHLINHIEKQFKPGMNWENYGINGWHIDHIIPCNSFDMINEIEQQKCFHYTNLQPLWALENLRKGDNIIL